MPQSCSEPDVLDQNRFARLGVHGPWGSCWWRIKLELTHFIKKNSVFIISNTREEQWGLYELGRNSE
jgi:hypothetical protein